MELWYKPTVHRGKFNICSTLVQRMTLRGNNVDSTSVFPVGEETYRYVFTYYLLKNVLIYIS